MSTTAPSVLFVCVHNAGRSQMAAAFLTHLTQGRVQVRSAGSTPAETVNPAVVEAMKEVGIDISAEIPKVLTTEAVQASDVVITMGCGDACPFFPGKRYLDWRLDDPAGRGVAAVRPIRDEIETRIRTLIAEILPSAGPKTGWAAPRIVAMTPEHAAEVLAIYQFGIDEGQATFETTAPTWQQFDTVKLTSHRHVALDEAGRVLGWVAASPVSDRCVYSGVVEHSVYVHPDARNLGVGLALLHALVASTEQAGIWTIQSGIFPENLPSLALHARAGFRVIGIRERIGRHHGVWRDVTMIERRSPLIS
ncbi:GNAT family N-acetyltransferase [Sphaerisporangium rhizosphaerae]